MGTPGREGAPSSVNVGVAAAREEMCHSGHPTRSRCGGPGDHPTGV